MPKRLRTALVCDPVCAQPFGHNVVGLKYFAERFSQCADRVVPVCSHALPDETREAYGYEAGFEFVYHRFIKLPSTRPADIRRLAESGTDGYADAAEAAAARDFERLFVRHDLGADDLVVFPSVDLYGALGLLDVLQARAAAGRPRCLLRFIGVMEDAALSPHTGLDALLHRIREFRKFGGDLRLCAETPRYAQRLSALVDGDVLVVPYPVHAEPEPPAKDDGCFRVALPGSARFDKGYGALLDLAASVRRRDPAVRIRFEVQSLPPADAVSHSTYTNQLGALPGMALLPASISEDRMNRMYAEAHLVIIPYDPQIYRWRGSAVLMEAISRTRPVLALEGAAFCDQVRYYGCGQVCSSPAAMADAIVEAASRRDRHQHRALLQSRRQFQRDAEHAFDDWVSA